MKVSASQAPGAVDALGIQLLGGFRVIVGRVPLASLRSGRARALLAYLVLDPDVAHPREALGALFWPDSSDAQARTNLRNVLHLLRHATPALDAALDVTTTTLAWRPPGRAMVDVHRFEAALSDVQTADPDDPNELIERCRGAARLYTGDLLVGDLDDWVVARRARLKDGYRDVLRRLVTALIDSGRAGEAASFARELVSTEPLDEVAHRLRIEAHGRARDRASAIRAYHECVATLERELGVRPDPATVALYQGLMGREPVTQPPPSKVASGSRRMVGRQDEWARLLLAWRSAPPGFPTAVAVSGEPGIGKTRLVEELREHAQRSSVAIGSARSHIGERTLANTVVVSWLRSPGIAPSLRHLGDDQRRTLARLLPELGPTNRSELASAADEQRRLYDAVAAALTASERPVLLVADDVQWSDDASLALIQYLLHRQFEIPMVIVLTLRLEEVVPSRHPAAALRDELIALDRLVEISVERLPYSAAVEFAGELMGARLGPDAADSLFAESEGNPLVITEMVRAGWNGAGPVAITPRLQAVIDARFRQLTDIATQVIDAAAVVGRPCSAAMLGEVSGLDVPALVQGVDELWKRGILIESGIDAYEFSHGKLREVAYDSIGPARRRVLHASAARAGIAHAAARGEPAASAVIAEHFATANQIDDAVTWLHRAALEAQAMFAYAEATQLLERALGLVPALPADVRHGRELELLSSLPGVLAGVDGYGTPRMSATHQRALTVSAVIGRELEPSFVRSMVMTGLCRDEFAEAAEMAEQLCAVAGSSGDEDLYIESHYLLGISAFWSAQLEEASRCFTTVVNRFRTDTRRHHQFMYGHDPYVVCLSRLANTLWFLGRPDDAAAACDAALGVAAEVAHPLSHDTAAIFACVLAIDLGDAERLRTGTALLGSLGMDSLPHATKKQALCGLLDTLDGRGQTGLSRIEAALDQCHGQNFYPGFQATLMRTLLAAHEIIGEPSAGLNAAERALNAGGTPLWTAEAHRLRAVFLHAQHAPRTEVALALERGHDAALRHNAHAHMDRIAAARQQLLGAD